MTTYQGESMADHCLVKLSFTSYIKIAAILGFCGGVVATLAIAVFTLIIPSVKNWPPGSGFLALVAFIFFVPFAHSLKAILAAVLGYPIYVWMCKNKGHFFDGKFIALKKRYPPTQPDRDVF